MWALDSETAYFVRLDQFFQGHGVHVEIPQAPSVLPGAGRHIIVHVQRDLPGKIRSPEENIRIARLVSLGLFGHIRHAVVAETAIEAAEQEARISALLTGAGRLAQIETHPGEAGTG